MIHSCQECGVVHDHPTPQVNPEVEIARINAESALAIAKLQSRTDKSVSEIEAESAVEVAEAQAEIMGTVLLAEANATDEVADEVPESSPVVVSTPIIDSGNDIEEAPEPPKHDESEDEPKPKKRSFGLGAW